MYHFRLFASFYSLKDNIKYVLIDEKSPNYYARLVDEWREAEEVIETRKLKLRELGYKIIEKCRKDLTEINHPNVERSVHPFDIIGKKLSISTPHVQRMAEGTIQKETYPPSEELIKLLIEISEVGLDILDETKYKVDTVTHEFRRLTPTTVDKEELDLDSISPVKSEDKNLNKTIKLRDWVFELYQTYEKLINIEGPNTLMHLSQEDRMIRLKNLHELINLKIISHVNKHVILTQKYADLNIKIYTLYQHKAPIETVFEKCDCICFSRSGEPITLQESLIYLNNLCTNL